MQKTNEVKMHRIEGFLLFANKELRRFNSTHRLIYLQQSAEKMYGAYTLLLELMVRREIYTHFEARRVAERLARKDREIKVLFENAELLHEYFYEARFYDRLIASKIRDSQKLIAGKLKRFAQ